MAPPYLFIGWEKIQNGLAERVSKHTFSFLYSGKGLTGDWLKPFVNILLI